MNSQTLEKKFYKTYEQQNFDIFLLKIKKHNEKTEKSKNFLSPVRRVFSKFLRNKKRVINENSFFEAAGCNKDTN